MLQKSLAHLTRLGTALVIVIVVLVPPSTGSAWAPLGPKWNGCVNYYFSNFGGMNGTSDGGARYAVEAGRAGWINRKGSHTPADVLSRARRAASLTASTMLPWLARPCPAMSNAVP